MRFKKGLLAGAVALAALAIVGVTAVFADHEDGVARNAPCDIFYWETSEPSVAVPATASTPATAVLVTSDTVRVPCDSQTLHIQFGASATVAADGFLQTFTRITCVAGPCLTAPAPFLQPAATIIGPAPTGSTRIQVCAPGNINAGGNNAGQVFLGRNGGGADFRISGITSTICGASPPGNGQIKGLGSDYQVEVFAYVTNGAGAPGAAAGRFDERTLTTEEWGAGRP